MSKLKKTKKKQVKKQQVEQQVRATADCGSEEELIREMLISRALRLDGFDYGPGSFIAGSRYEIMESAGDPFGWGHND